VETVLIVGDADSPVSEFKAALSELAPQVECIEVSAEDAAKKDCSLVVSFANCVEDFLVLSRQLEFLQVPFLQVRYQDFGATNDADQDLWNSPLMDEQAKVVLLNMPVAVGSLISEVKKEFALDEVELDDSSTFNVVLPDDVARVVSSVAIQILSGANNWGEYAYATGGKLTWYRLCSFLLEQTEETSVELLAGTGLGIDRALDGEELKHAFGIKPHGWRVGLPEYWESFS